MLNGMRGLGNPWGSALVLLLAIGVADAGKAQIIPDESLGSENSRVAPGTVKGQPADRIDGGAARGANLFHSFREFNVGEGQRVYFNNPVGIRNIFTRVTGTNVSNILGTLGIEGGANLFLLNPNGILLGQNAQLDVAGSFVGTTATAIQFGTQGFFTATPDALPPLLTISPSALFFNSSNVGSIVSRAGLGFSVANGQTLALVGGTVTLDGSHLSAVGGQIELDAVGSGVVNLDGDLLTLHSPDTTTRTDIAIGNGSSLDVRAGNGGSLALDANNINLSGGSQLNAGIAKNQGSINSRAGNILVNATGTLRLTGQSRIENSVSGGGSGAGGNIQVNANSLLFTEGSKLKVSTFGQGNAGDVVINARDRVSFDGFVPDASGQDSNASGINSYVDFAAIGQGGDIRITADSVSVTNEASIATFSFGQGNAGNIQIAATGLVNFSGAIHFGGATPQDLSSNAISKVQNSGNSRSGNLEISANSIELTNGAELLALVSVKDGAGDTAGNDAGRITLNAHDRIVIDGANPTRQTPSLVRSQVTNGRGQSGNIQVSANSIAVTSGGQVNTSTHGTGNAGNIDLTARDRISVEGASPTLDREGTVIRSEVDAGIPSNPNGGVTGQSGNIQVSANSIAVTNGGQINTSTNGTGNAGNIDLTARDRISVEGVFPTLTQDGLPVRSEVVAGVNSANGREGGSLRISTGSLWIRSGGGLDITTRGSGNAGSMVIRARDRVILDGFSIPIERGELFNSSRISNAVLGTGEGGDIQITADVLRVTNGAGIITGTSGFGNVGDVTLAARLVSFDGTVPGATTSSVVTSGVFPGGRGQGGDIRICADFFSLTNGAQLFSNTFNQGNAGNIFIDANRILLDGASENGQKISSILASAEQSATGQGGNVYLHVRDSLTIANGARISTTTQGSGKAGDITINARNGNVLLSGRGRNSLTGLLAGTLNTGQGAGGSISLRANDLRIENGATINTLTRNGNPGGSVTVNARTLEVTQGGQITTNTASTGRAGNISLDIQGQATFRGRDRTKIDQADQDRLSSEEREYLKFRGRASGLFANTLPGSTGQGGDVNLTANQLFLRQGAQFTAASRGRGNSGDLTLTAQEGRFNNAQVLAETISSRGGSIHLRDFDRLQLENSRISASTRSGQAGNVQVNATGRVQLSDRSIISVQAGQGRAGNLTLSTPIVSLDQGVLSATTGTTQGNRGANIQLNDLDLLLLRNGSQIQADATRSATGGNININSEFIVAAPFENSDITADAGVGDGGRVVINTQGVFGTAAQPQQTLQSDITATSDQGVQGVVTINRPTVDPSRGLIELPTDVGDASSQINQACPTGNTVAKDQSNFVITGHGGLPANPEDLLNGEGLLADWVTLNTPELNASDTPAPEITPESSANMPLVEAQGWVIGSKGEVILVAQPAAVASQPDRLKPVYCR